jgi:hypothetical protein
MMADGSVVKGVTVAQYPQAASFDTAAACESTRDARGSKALAASQLAERQLEAANAARYSYAPYDEQGRLKDPKRDRELAEAQRKAGVAYFEAGI